MKKKNSVLISKKIKKFNKTIKVAADKSLSLRALMLASQCIGISKIKNLLESEDVLNCLKALRILGVKIVKDNNIYLIKIIDIKYNNISKNAKNFLQYKKQANDQIRGSINDSYDFFINSKYTIKINEKTLERVKNYFR